MAGGIDAATIRLTILGIFFYGVACLQGSLVQAGFRCNGLYAIGTTLQAATMLVESLVAAVAVTRGAGLPLVAFAYLACRVGMLGFQALLFRHLVPWLSIGFRGASAAEVRDLLHPAAAIMAFPIAQSIFLQGSALVVGLAVSTASVAIYTSVRTLTRAGIQLTTLVNHAVMPELSIAAARADTTIVRKITLLTVANSLAVLVPCALVLLIFGPQIVTIWTRGVIQPSYALIAAMTMVMVVNGMWHPLSNLLLAINRQASYSYIYAVAAAVAVAAAYPLCRAFGAVGAAWAILGLDLFMSVRVIQLVRVYLYHQSMVTPSGRPNQLG